MKVKFRDYQGTAGDLHILLIAETEDGRKESILFSTFFGYELGRWIAEKRLIWRLKRYEQTI